MNAGKAIYIAMHDQIMAIELENLLKAKGYSAITADSSRELYDMIENKMPAVVILTVLLPDANGLEACKLIKGERRTAEVKVAIISSLKRSAKFALEAKGKFGADLYLEMPIDPLEIMSSVEKLLESDLAPPETEFEPGGEPETTAGEETVWAAEEETVVEEPQTPEPEEAETWSEPEPEPRIAKPAAKTKEDLSDSGRLGPILLPELLLTLYQKHANGILHVKAWEEQREILLRDGVPMAIRSNFIPDDSLGQILIARGAVDRGTIEQSLVKAKKENIKLGEMLVQEGKLSKRELRRVLQVQAKRKMNTAFRWKEGSYEFRPGPVAEIDFMPIEQDMLSILIAGIGRHYDMSKLEERLYQNKDGVVVRTDVSHLKPTDLRITKTEWRLLNLIDGERTLGEVIADSHLNFARTFQILYLFLLFGLIRFQEGDRFFRLDEAVTYRARSEAGPATEDLTEEAEEQAQPTEEEIPDAGDLAKMPLIRFLYDLFTRQAVGKLVLARGENEEVLYISNGLPVQIHSNRIGPNTLGNLLVAQGKISELERDKALSSAKEMGKPLGEMLLNDGLLTPHELYEALLAQMENKLIALFSWDSGAYRFEEGALTEQESLPITIDLTKLIVRGVRDAAQADRVERELGKYRSFPLVRTRSQADLTALFPDPRESALVSMIDGRKTLGEILERAMLDQTRALQMIYSLLQLGLIQFQED